MLEFVGHEGYFRNTTVLGSITGEALDLSVIDDPIKGRAEAQSEVTREKTWNWLTDDVLSRFSENAGLIMIMTRWHVDDTAGRLIEHFWPRACDDNTLPSEGASSTPRAQCPYTSVAGRLPTPPRRSSPVQRARLQ